MAGPLEVLQAGGSIHGTYSEEGVDAVSGVDHILGVDVGWYLCRVPMENHVLDQTPQDGGCFLFDDILGNDASRLRLSEFGPFWSIVTNKDDGSRTQGDRDSFLYQPLL